MDDARNIRGSKVTIMVVGNKIDLPDQREVSTEEGQKLASELDVEFIETSAKAGINVKALFKNLVSNLPNQDSDQPESKENVKLEGPDGEAGEAEDNTQKKGCC